MDYSVNNEDENLFLSKEELLKKYAVVEEDLACDEDELMTPEEERNHVYD